MLFNKILEEELYSKYDPLYNFMYYGSVSYVSNEITHKKYGSKQTFSNKAILIADIVTEEIKNALPDLHGISVGDVVLLAFEFAKHNYKTQNTFLIRDKSDLKNVFENINPRKTKILKETFMPYSDDTFLAGIHFVGMVRLSDEAYNGNNRIRRLLKEEITESREDGTYCFSLAEKDIYSFPILEKITKEDAYFIMKDRKRTYDPDYIGII